MVGAIVALAKAHGKRLVAEGIETADDAALLAAMGCEYGQGYHFGRPVDGADVSRRDQAPGGGVGSGGAASAAFSARKSSHDQRFAAGLRSR